MIHLLSPGPWRYVTDSDGLFSAVQDAFGQEIANLSLMPKGRSNGPVMAEAFEMLVLLRNFAAGTASQQDIRDARELVARMTRLEDVG